MIKSSHLIYYGFIGILFVLSFGIKHTEFILGFWNIDPHIFIKQSYFIIYNISIFIMGLGLFANISNYIGKKLDSI